MELHPVGIVHSPYKEIQDAPRQGKFRSEVESTLEIKPEYAEALRGIERSRHLIVMYWCHKSDRERLTVIPPHLGELRGVFACRSPVRPNPINLCVVSLVKRKGNNLLVKGLDALDGSYVVDIKPYLAHIDSAMDTGDPSQQHGTGEPAAETSLGAERGGVFAYRDQFPEFDETVFIAPGAVLIGRVTLEKNVNVWFNAVLRADVDSIVIGSGSNIQDNCVLHEDPGYPLVVGKNVTVGHSALLHSCTVGDGALIGMSAVLLTGSKVGAGAVIGAGSLVPEGAEIPPSVLALGTPARVIRELTNEDKDRFKNSAQHYVDIAREYMNGAKIRP